APGDLRPETLGEALGGRAARVPAHVADDAHDGLARGVLREEIVARRVDPDGHDRRARLRIPAPDERLEPRRAEAKIAVGAHEPLLGREEQSPLDAGPDAARPLELEVDRDEVEHVDERAGRVLEAEPARPELLEVEDVVALRELALELALDLAAEHVGVGPARRLPLGDKDA